MAAADPELAAKLELRLAAIQRSSGNNNNNDDDNMFGNDQFRSLVSPPPPPPPPPSQLRHVTPPYKSDGNDLTDMDELIAQLMKIRNSSSNSDRRQTSPEQTNLAESNDRDSAKEIRHSGESAKALNNIAAVTNTTKDNHSDDESSNLILPKCSAPTVRIEHHKTTMQKSKSRSIDDNFKHELDELEQKLEKQRRLRGGHTFLDLLQPTSTNTSSGLTNTQRSVLMESSHKNGGEAQSNRIDIRSPPPTPKKPSSPLTTMSTQTTSSPTCSSSTSLTWSGNEGDELAQKLARRNRIVDGEQVEPVRPPKLSIYSEFHEFSRKQIKYFTETFKKYDEDNDNYIDFNELKRMMEKLGEAQTHIALKNILKLVDEDQDGKVSLREFLLIFRYAAIGQLTCSQVFNEMAASVVDVSKKGVHAAANFFQAKIEEQKKGSKFLEEIRAEQDEKNLKEAEKKQRRQRFLANKAVFI